MSSSSSASEVQFVDSPWVICLTPHLQIRDRQTFFIFVPNASMLDFSTCSLCHLKHTHYPRDHPHYPGPLIGFARGLLRPITQPLTSEIAGNEFSETIFVHTLCARFTSGVFAGGTQFNLFKRVMECTPLKCVVCGKIQNFYFSQCSLKFLHFRPFDHTGMSA
jgi:hypothetical protein